jgi:2-polyprenyl-3-methyl-5-hydroxy-6-metoxy-1,4-benzoquinol methylase
VSETTAPAFDQHKAEAFAGRVLGALNGAAFCLMASIGHRAGLFDAMRGQPPSTSDELARRAGLNERYVREWLGAMTAFEAVQVDPESVRFSLPDEHAAFLTRPAAADNMAVFTQYIGLLGSVEDDILRCFKEGGGVPYSRYPRFHAVMAEDSGQSVMSSLETHILPLVPGLTERLAQGLRMLDVGCGQGRIITRLAELFPASRFVGMDLSMDAIATARSEASSRGLSNVEFMAVDLTDFDKTAEPESFDVITTFDAVHDQARPLAVLTGICRSLVPDGVYLMQEIKGSSHVDRNIGLPLGTLLYAISCMHCMTVSLAQGGEGLGAMWGEEKARDYLQRAGFRSVEKHVLAHDIQNDWYVITK